MKPIATGLNRAPGVGLAPGMMAGSRSQDDSYSKINLPAGLGIQDDEGFHLGDYLLPASAYDTIIPRKSPRKPQRH